MSTRPPEASPSGTPPERKPVTLPRLAEMKVNAEPIVMITAYDHPSAQVVEAVGVDMVLVGDSAAMTVLGHDSTVPVGMDEMLMLAAAVRRGLRTPFLVGDMPFGSYERSNDQAIENALRFIKEAGCDAVKLERGGASVDRAWAIVRAGIPVMGHVGLTPQTATALGGFKAQGKTAERAAQIAEEALALQAAGCFAIVFEAVPAAVTEALMPKMEIPVIGIGAGAGTDGQVLVFHDLLGIFGGHAAKFVKRYANVREDMIAGVTAYTDEVRAGSFPAPEHIYSIDPSELTEFRRWIDQDTLAAGEGTFSYEDWDTGL
jgi:3-methyl-2-oxobutanoate hydroxymethyltransferase